MRTFTERPFFGVSILTTEPSGTHVDVAVSRRRSKTSPGDGPTGKSKNGINNTDRLESLQPAGVRRFTQHLPGSSRHFGDRSPTKRSLDGCNPWIGAVAVLEIASHSFGGIERSSGINDKRGASIRRSSASCSSAVVTRMPVFFE
jgi:hypothetical protein